MATTKAKNAALVLVLVLVGLALAEDPNPNGAYSKVFRYSGGLPFCSQCGEPGQYACSNQANWLSNMSWTDVIPTGSVPTKITVTTRGSYKCGTNSNTFKVAVNNIPLDVLTTSGSANNCQCASCDGDITFENYSPYGWPSFNVGGANALSMTVFSDQICLNSVNLTVHYTKDFYHLQSKYVELGVGTSTGGICGNSKYTTCSSSCSFVFKDPIPSGNLPVAIAVDLYGKYFLSSSSRCYSSYGLKVSVQGNSLGALSRSQSYYNQTTVFQGCNLNNDNDCNGRWPFRNGVFYQNGIPTWTYGGDNTIRLDQTSSYPQYSRFGRLGIWVYYVAKPSEDLIN